MELSGQLILLAMLARQAPPVPIDQEAEWASELVWAFWGIEESLAPAENQTLVCDLLRTKV